MSSNKATATSTNRHALLPACTFQRLLAVIRERLQQEDSVVVAIDGAAGLGKSTLARQLQQEFLGDATVVHTDDYLAERHECLIRGISAYDPQAISMDDLVRNITGLSVQHRDVIVRPYQHPTGRHGTPTLMPSRPIIIVEGGHALATAILAVVRPVGIFLQASRHAMYALRCERDIRERGATAGSFEAAWPRMLADYERFVLPHRDAAALVIERRMARASRALRDHLTPDAAHPSALVNRCIHWPSSGQESSP